MIVTSNKEWLLNKYQTLDKIAEKNNEPAAAEKITKQGATLKQMLKDNQTTEGEEKGVSWVRFHTTGLAEKLVLQLEKQPDGRWAMNTRVTKE